MNPEADSFVSSEQESHFKGALDGKARFLVAFLIGGGGAVATSQFVGSKV